MGKNGPCHHCGVTSTPLWRNGPPEKPILCNACGSRWRTKGSLANYTPLHAREPIELEEHKVVKIKSMPYKTKEHKSRKQINGVVESEREMPFSSYDQSYVRALELDASNRSSSGSAISYSESCAHFGAIDASDWIGSTQSNAWDSLVPSKKRSVNLPKSSPVEKLTRDLYSIWHEQQSSNLSGSSDEDLLFEGETPSGSAEIGHGGMLLRYPRSKAMEEESEASSLPLDNKLSNEASFPLNSESKRTTLPSVGKLKKSQDHAKRHRFSPDNMNMLRDKDSLLRFTDLKDVVNLEVFMELLTIEEQQRLMRYLPSIDTVTLPDSLNSMFSSPQIMENFSSFQQLLQEGIFDLSFCQMNVEDCRTLKRLVLLNLTKSSWVELYRQLKDAKQKQVNGLDIVGSTNFMHANLTPLRRPYEAQSQQLKESKGTMRSPKRVNKSGITDLHSTKSSIFNPSKSGSKDMADITNFVDSGTTCVSPGGHFASFIDHNLVLGFIENSSEQDLLLDVRCSSSFPEAELLQHHPWNQRALSDSSRAESTIIAEEESLCNFPNSNFSCQHLKQSEGELPT